MVALAALITAIVVTPCSLWLAPRVGLLDRPGPLKVNRRPVPYLGGLGVAGALAWGAGSTRPGLLVPLGAALVLGTFDDAKGLSPRVRLAGELAVGVAVGLALPGWDPRALFVVFAALVTLALCNGVNMVDGLDGLAGGVALASALGFYAVLRGDAATIALTLAAGLVVFLAFNRPPARLYLGDGGAYVVGTALAILFVVASNEESGATFGAAALLVGVPLVELVFAVVRRVAAGQRLTAGDRDHVYDQLHARGASQAVAALACVVAQAGLTAIALATAPRSAALALAVAGACAVVILVAGAATGFLTPARRG